MLATVCGVYFAFGVMLLATSVLLTRMMAVLSAADRRRRTVLDPITDGHTA